MSSNAMKYLPAIRIITKFSLVYKLDDTFSDSGCDSGSYLSDSEDDEIRDNTDTKVIEETQVLRYEEVLTNERRSLLKGFLYELI